jgi:hypothetical protein
MSVTIYPPVMLHNQCIRLHLQKPSELAISVRYVLVVIHNGIDDIPQRKQASIDVDAFFESSSLCLGPLCPLTASQIHLYTHQINIMNDWMRA